MPNWKRHGWAHFVEITVPDADDEPPIDAWLAAGSRDRRRDDGDRTTGRGDYSDE